MYHPVRRPEPGWLAAIAKLTVPHFRQTDLSSAGDPAALLFKSCSRRSASGDFQTPVEHFAYTGRLGGSNGRFAHSSAGTCQSACGPAAAVPIGGVVMTATGRLPNVGFWGSNCGKPDAFHWLTVVRIGMALDKSNGRRDLGGDLVKSGPFHSVIATFACVYLCAGPRRRDTARLRSDPGSFPCV